LVNLNIEWNGIAEIGGRVFLFFFSIPFVIAGTGLVVGPWVYGSWAARRMRYALSNKRAYIATHFLGRKMQTYALHKDDSIEIEQGRRADNVKFHVRTRRDSDGDYTTEKIGFDNIPDGEKVYHMIRKIQREEL
ncbi:MAG: hypothetical protein AAFN59_09240, partial [Pseudomonadota bacterium]